MTYSSEELGYLLDLPPSWVEIPPSVLEGILGAMTKPGGQLRWDSGFQSSSEMPWLSYPYLLVQVMPYAAVGSARPPTIRQMKSIVHMMARIPVDAGMEAVMDEEASGLIEDGAIVDPPSFDEERLRFTYELKADVALAGAIRGRCVGYFTKDAMVQAVFYDRAGQWDASAADRTSILDSFHIAQSATFEPEPGGIAGGGVFHAGRRALIGGIVGGLIGLVVTMFKRKAQQRGN